MLTQPYQCFMHHKMQYISDSTIYFVEVIFGGRLALSKLCSLGYHPPMARR